MATKRLTKARVAELVKRIRSDRAITKAKGIESWEHGGTIRNEIQLEGYLITLVAELLDFDTSQTISRACQAEVTLEELEAAKGLLAKREAEHAEWKAKQVARTPA